MLRAENVSKIYRTSKGDVNALDDVSIQVKTGEFVVVQGPSGSGKTTLLMSFGGMQRPNAGTVTVNGANIYEMNARERAKFRAQNIGFVFQMFYLVPYLNVMDNVLLPPSDSGGNKNRRGQAAQLLGRLGLLDRADHRPSELSAGERQRAAIARALCNQPKILLADEPTGNLDPDNAALVFQHLAEYHKEGGTVMVVTHGMDADRYADRVIHMHGGRIADGARSEAASVSISLPSDS